MLDITKLPDPEVLLAQKNLRESLEKIGKDLSSNISNRSKTLSGFHYDQIISPVLEEIIKLRKKYPKADWRKMSVWEELLKASFYDNRLKSDPSVVIKEIPIDSTVKSIYMI